MNLQDLFYIIGIICMTLYTVLLVILVVLLFFIKKKINKIHEDFEQKIDRVKDAFSHPERIATHVGAVVADTAITRAARIFNSKKGKR